MQQISRQQQTEKERKKERKKEWRKESNKEKEREWAPDCLELVAKINFSSQDLEEHHHLLIWQLTILSDQRQYRHRR